MQYNKSYYGAHVSIKKGLISAIKQINTLEGNMLQIFISNPMSTKISTNTKYEFTYEQIRNKLLETNTKLVIHLPYVINLAKPLGPKPLNEWHIQMLMNQLTISELIGSIGCVVHVGKYLSLTELEALDNMFNALKLIIEFIRQQEMTTHIILETSAGQGTELLKTSNNSLIDLANFYNRFDETEKKHIKICVDTCHIFTAGYDIRTKEQVKHFFNDFQNQIGLCHIDLIHLNDSKSAYGTKKDRHANLGYGQIGMNGLRHIIRYGIFYKIPIILETPDEDLYLSEIKFIKKVDKGVNKWINQQI